MFAVLKRVCRWLLVCSVAGFLIGALAISLYGLQDRLVPADLAVVPGNTVNLDGTPSGRLQGRLDAALKLYRDGYCTAILVSGGIGKEGFDEAAVMKAYLVSRGVPDPVIFTDNQGTNTYETARFTASLMQNKGFQRPILVSQYFHLARFRLALRQFGVESAGHMHAEYYEWRDVYSLSREVVGYVAYQFKQTSA
ncbi:YdcF family protein [Chitinivorax sp. B]|uniref:YdcF family protein n=1 Tax=Chitinivorax sp. B TaxID=2502235 RepID=UPI0010F668C0|nr:YdcF family protein [Chitinivorax sp. B]